MELGVVLPPPPPKFVVVVVGQSFSWGVPTVHADETELTDDDVDDWGGVIILTLCTRPYL